MRLYDYQKSAVAWHAAKKYSINAFVMGLGKTVTALALHRLVSDSTLVVCPKYLIQNWKDEVVKFNIQGHIEFINYAMFKNLKDRRYDLIVVDEAHYLKTPSSKRSKLFMDYIVDKPPTHLLLMTGTPCKNDVSELYNLLRLCNVKHKDPEITKFRNNIFSFKSKFMNQKIKKFGKKVIRDFSGFKNRSEYISLCKPYILKKTLDEVKLPSKVDKVLTVGNLSLDNELSKLLKKFDKDAYMTLKAKTAKAVAPYTVDHCKTMKAQCVIFTDHIGSCEFIAGELEVPFIHGSVDTDKRNKIIDDFKNGEDQFLVATYKTAGVGLNLVNANYMVFNDLPFVPADLEQAKARILRLGQSRTCFYYYMALSDLYWKLHAMLKNKTEVLSTALDL